MNFTFTPLEIPDVVLIGYDVFKDTRGFFLESYKQKDFVEHGLPPFVQDNHSRSTRGVLRGLHYQKKPAAVGKLVRCLRGKIFDVAVDIRKNSATYGRWVSVELDEETSRMLYIPPGFAHGFMALSEVADVFYKMTGPFSLEHDRAILWSDPDIAIRWPLKTPQVSAKDAAAPGLKDADNDFI